MDRARRRRGLQIKRRISQQPIFCISQDPLKSSQPQNLASEPSQSADGQIGDLPQHNSPSSSPSPPALSILSSKSGDLPDLPTTLTISSNSVPTAQNPFSSFSFSFYFSSFSLSSLLCTGSYWSAYHGKTEVINDMRAGKNTYWCLMHFERVWFWTYKERNPTQGELSLVRAPGHMVTVSKGTKTKAYNRTINSSFNWACTKPITN